MSEGDLPLAQIFYQGKFWDAKSLLIKFIRRAKKELIVIDAYPGVATLDMLAKHNTRLSTTFSDTILLYDTTNTKRAGEAQASGMRNTGVSSSEVKGMEGERRTEGDKKLEDAEGRMGGVLDVEDRSKRGRDIAESFDDAMYESILEGSNDPHKDEPFDIIVQTVNRKWHSSGRSACKVIQKLRKWVIF